MSALIRWHLVMAAWHAAWAAFWMGQRQGQVPKAAEPEPDSPELDTTPDSADTYVRSHARRL